MSLDRRASREMERPIQSRSDMIDYFRSGEKPRAQWRVGIEHEKFGMQQGTWAPVPYGGERGIEALLRRIAGNPGWEAILEDGHVIGLDGQGGITLEPGAQVELNGPPVTAIREICAQFHRHLAELRKMSEPLGIVWVGLGVHPLHPVKDLPRVPRERYRIMREYLPTRGELALDMMHASASVQVSFDFADEADMVDKMRTGLGVTPLVGAIFANSSISEGRPSGFVSRRLEVWRHTDPDRTGLIPFVFDEGFGYERYLEWALDVPMFFILRESGYRAMDGMTFRRFLESGLDGERATLADFDRHLTTLFPEVRLKRILEMRCADAVPPDLLCTIPALWKGLLYDDEARGAARALVARWSPEQRAALWSDVARSGLAARTPDGPLLPRARELAALARSGLRRLAREHPDLGDPGEEGFLDPLDELLERGKSPGEIVLERWAGEWNGELDRLIDYARY